MQRQGPKTFWQRHCSRIVENRATPYQGRIRFVVKARARGLVEEASSEHNQTRARRSKKPNKTCGKTTARCSAARTTHYLRRRN